MKRSSTHTKHTLLPLTGRETKCLILSAEDKTLIEIAEYMHVSPETVKRYRKVILRKLGCQTIVGAFAAAIKNGSL